MRPAYPSIAFFRQMPKADLHVHIDGAVRPATIVELARESGRELPSYDPDELARFVTAGRGCSSLAEFLKTFDVFYPLLESPEAIERIAAELVEDEAADGVVYVEARFAPVLQAKGGFGIERAARAALAGLAAGSKKTGIGAGLILCAYRSEPPETSVETARTAIALMDEGVAGLDLAGDERNFRALPHVEAFAMARDASLPVTVHAGEDGPAENVAEAVFLLGARRLGHAIRLADDTELLGRVAAENIAIETCLTSNAATGMVRSIADHPLPAFLAAGATVTLNTDDPAVCRTSLSKEFELAASSFCLAESAVRKIAIAGFEASFAAPGAKARLAEKCRRWFDGCSVR